MEQLRQDIHDLLAAQHLTVLATEQDGQPYTSLMAYAFSPDLSELIVATSRDTRKHANLLTEARVALLVDSRANNRNDFRGAAALTIVGEAGEAQGEALIRCRQRYLARHPALESFLLAPTTALFVIRVSSYMLVENFQQCRELRLMP